MLRLSDGICFVIYIFVALKWRKQNPDNGLIMGARYDHIWSKYGEISVYGSESKRDLKYL